MAASSDFNEYDYYVISDDEEWEKNTISGLKKKKIRCISRKEWIPGKSKLDNLIEPLKNCKKVVVGFQSSSLSGNPNYLAQTVVQKMLDNNSINKGKLIPVRISKDAMIPECLSLLTPANGWEDNFFEMLLYALYEEKSATPQMSKMSADKAWHTDESKDEQITCQTHSTKKLEFYCSTCKISACKRCENIFNCYRNKHEVIEMKVAVNEFNGNANELIAIAEEITNRLHGTFDYINKDRSHFNNHLQLCRNAIEHQEETLIKQIKEKSRALKADLGERYKTKKEEHESKIKDLDSKLSQVNNLKSAINALINKPEETEKLQSLKTTLNTIRDKVLGTDVDKSFQMMTPYFNPSKQLNELLNTEGIGKIKTADSMMCKVTKDDEAITVKKVETFVVTVSSVSESDTCKLAATSKDLQ
ncbi:tripartite motif-containing protein 54-like [Anneissia japonica]|uniref:tripartite motif-containing protein 54-like n=1 Tax=Anneissia japonica TaxID=1529436 RepID=UPI0014255EA6|nr:tripartite motif-containing protein 54-like [Anneissia japonica]